MRILSGVKPSGNLHIGNYLGALRQLIENQDKNETFFLIVDLHSMTSPYDSSELKRLTLEIATHYLAAGFDPKKSAIFIQSHILEHPMLMWLLNTLTPYGELTRMTQFKDALNKNKSINADILNYPILMAADILLYKAKEIPVGEDQLQHLELARTIAKKFNRLFGATFPEPKAMISEIGAVRIKSLSQPDKKMSKSSGEAIYITDSPEIIRKKIMSAVTDSGKEIVFNKDAKPGISNLLTIFSLFSRIPIKKIETVYKNKTYQEFKKDLSEIIIKNLEPIQKRFKELQKDPSYVKKILSQGEKKAALIAKKTMMEVKKKMGLL